jgi:hypothetical protein
VWGSGDGFSNQPAGESMTTTYTARATNPAAPGGDGIAELASPPAWSASGVVGSGPSMSRRRNPTRPTTRRFALPGVVDASRAGAARESSATTGLRRGYHGATAPHQSRVVESDGPVLRLLISCGSVGLGIPAADRLRSGPSYGCRRRTQGVASRWVGQLTSAVPEETRWHMMGTAAKTMGRRLRSSR